MKRIDSDALQQKARQMVEDEKSARHEALVNTPHGAGPFTVLVVDDNAVNVEVAAQLLKNHNYVVDVAMGGQECLNKVLVEPPDLILLDWMMPRVSGADVLRQLRAHDITCGLPVIMVTARTTEQDRITGLQMGADDYLTKPIVPAELILRVSAMLTRLNLARQNAVQSEIIIKQEKLAQIGEMMTDLSHELKNLNLVSLSAFDTEKERMLLVLESYSWVHESWRDVCRALFKEPVEFTERNRRTGEWGDMQHSDSEAIYSFEDLKDTFCDLDVDGESLHAMLTILMSSDAEKVTMVSSQIGIVQRMIGMNRSAARAETLLRSVLNYSRANDEYQICDLMEVVDSCKNLMHKKLTRGRVDLEVTITPPMIAEASTSDIHQIMLNLVRNAHDAVSEFEGDKSIVIRDASTESHCVLQIENTGIAIEKDLCEKVFERGFSTKGKKGTGIGLFVSRKLAVRNGGDLTACVSDEGRTRFELTLPKLEGT